MYSICIPPLTLLQLTQELHKTIRRNYPQFDTYLVPNVLLKSNEKMQSFDRFRLGLCLKKCLIVLLYHLQGIFQPFLEEKKIHKNSPDRKKQMESFFSHLNRLHKN